MSTISPAPEATAATGQEEVTNVATEFENNQESATGENESADQSDSAIKDDDNEDSDTEVSEDKKPKVGFQRRIEKAKAKAREEAQAEIEYWKKAAMGKTTAVEEQVQTVSSDKPKFSDYNDVEAFAEAMADWKIESKLSEREQKTRVDKVHNSYQDKVKEFVKTTPDFHAVLEEANDVDMCAEILNTVMESDIGPQIAYYLGSNIDEVERINDLPAHKRLIALGKLEAKLEGQSTKVVDKKVISKAPSPGKVLSGGAVVKSKSLDDPTLSSADWIKLRNSQTKYR